MDNNLNPQGVPQQPVQPQYIPQQPVEPQAQYVPQQPVEPQAQYVPQQPVEPQAQYVPQQPYVPQAQYIPQQPYVPQPQYVPQQPYVPQPQNIPPQMGPDGKLIYQPLDKRLIKSCRHKAEKRWYRRLFVLNILIIVIAIAYFFYSMDENKKYYDNMVDYYTATIEEAQNKSENGNDQDTGDSAEKKENDKKESLEDKINDMPENLEYLIAIIFTAIAIPFIVSYAYAQYRSMSVRITEKNYPEIYAIVEEFAQKLGMKRVPKVYMVQGNGVLNAFSSFIPFRQYIEIYADLLEVAYREHHDMDTIRFIIAHEMSHIYLKHATMHYYYGMMFSQAIPILGPTASRAREYSCDRLAQLLSGSDGIDAMMTLIAGIHLYKQVDKIDYLQNALSVNGFFVFCYNLVCSHPIMTKRILALNDPMKRSGQLY